MPNKVAGQFNMPCDILPHCAAENISFLQLFSSQPKKCGVNGMENSGNLTLLIYAGQEEHFPYISMIKHSLFITIKFFAVCLLFVGTDVTRHKLDRTQVLLRYSRVLLA